MNRQSSAYQSGQLQGQEAIDFQNDVRQYFVLSFLSYQGGSDQPASFHPVNDRTWNIVILTKERIFIIAFTSARIAVSTPETSCCTLFVEKLLYLFVKKTNHIYCVTCFEWRSITWYTGTE